MSFAPVDICFLLVILVFAVSALCKGLIKEFFSKAALIGALAAAIAFTPGLDVYMADTIRSPIVSRVLSFLLIFVAVFLVMCIIQHVTARIFSGEIMRGLDRALGLLLGIAEGIVVVSFVIIVMRVQPWFDTEQVFAGSLFWRLLSGFLNAPEEYLRGMGIAGALPASAPEACLKGTAA